MGDGTNFEIPRTALDVLLRPLATARQDTRQQTAIVGWTAVVKDVAVTASTYQRWSRSRLFPADGPLTVRAAGSARCRRSAARSMRRASAGVTH